MRSSNRFLSSLLLLKWGVVTRIKNKLLLKVAFGIAAATLIGSYAVAQIDFGQVLSRKCATGYLCLFENSEWAGRRLQFNIPGKIDLHDYGFEKQLSSWVNNTDRDAVWAYLDGNGAARTGCMKAQTRATYIGDRDNDKITTIYFGMAEMPCQ